MQIATTLCKLCQCPVGARFSFGFRGIKKRQSHFTVAVSFFVAGAGFEPMSALGGYEPKSLL